MWTVETLRLKIILAPCSFKGSLTAPEAAAAMAEGVVRIVPKAEVISIPLADGGEGTVAALVAATGGYLSSVEVMGPLGEPVTATYGLLDDGQTTVIEMAAASGLTLVPPQKRNPLKTTTYGTGELMLAAIRQGCRRLIIGIGGSATNDGGCGMAQALGVKFFDAQGKEIPKPIRGETLGRMAAIDASGIPMEVKNCHITVACDVDNPLLGPQGATMVFGPQKGADAEQLQILERNMARAFDVIERDTGRSVRHAAGAGAAGGLGAGLMAFTNATLMRGAEMVLKACLFADKIAGADLILTGEGRIDAQTAHGKLIHGVAMEAAKQKIPVVALAGAVEPDAEVLHDMGVTALFSIIEKPCSLEYAMAHAAELLQRATERIVKLWITSRG